MVTVCSGFLKYLLISVVDPTCPKCEPYMSLLLKKPKINCSLVLSMKLTCLSVFIKPF